MDSWQAYEKFGMDYAMDVDPSYRFTDADMARWRVRRRGLGGDDEGGALWEETIETPKGTLHRAGAANRFTEWETEVLVKDQKDFALWAEFAPLPVAVDFGEIRKTRYRLVTQSRRPAVLPGGVRPELWIRARVTGNGARAGVRVLRGDEGSRGLHLRSFQPFLLR